MEHVEINYPLEEEEEEGEGDGIRSVMDIRRSPRRGLSSSSSSSSSSLSDVD